MLTSLYRKFCRPYINRALAEEISGFSRYFDSLQQVSPLPADSLALFRECEAKAKLIVQRVAEIGAAVPERGERRLFLLNGNCNHSYDIAALLRELHGALTRHDRIVLVLYNPYLRWLYYLANWVGVRRGEVPSTFCTRKDVNTLARLAGLEVVRERLAAYFPFACFGLGDLVNRVFRAIPVVRWLALAEMVLLRPVVPSQTKPSLSIVIPARNERGNIAGAIERMPDFGAPTEVIFVEGHSNDGTWEEIQRVVREYRGPLRLQAAQQKGKGKSDAVRLGFSLARHELLTILDADLTMPPEQLARFYEAYTSGLGDFINGNRLVYPMEGEAMRFLNHLGNIFFAKLLSFVLETNLGDSLCGTKLMAKRDYERFVAWRGDFGDFDPFGDFEIIFPACIMGLGVMDLPIRYRARTYGSTNIHRFRHGFILLRMTMIGLFRIRLGI